MQKKKSAKYVLDYSKYAGQWVALSKDRSKVIASDVDLVSTMDKAKKNGCDAPFFTYIAKDAGAAYLL